MGDCEKESAIQILDFQYTKDENGKRISTMKLNDTALQSVCSKAGDRPVVLISIAGPSRKGKSFFLSFVLRYLKSLVTEDSTDWMDLDNQEQALIGFKWGNGIEIQTIGIWIWSQPFIIKIGNKESAVFIMDTQGVFDEKTDQQDWCRIIGLSLLLSSMTILNMSDLLEDNLQQFDSFIQYGLIANQNSTESSKPFQKLLFLMRDWSNPVEFPYGIVGGRKWITKKLSTEDKPDMPESSKTIRSNIYKCFQALDCCVLPHPGEKVKKDIFQGAIKDLDRNFRKQISQCIETYFCQDELITKEIGGMDVSARALVQYFQKYVELFNCEDTPKPMSIYDATIQITNTKSIEKCFTKYQQEMGKIKPNHVGFISQNQLTSRHTKQMEASLEEYKKAKNYGDESVRTEYGEKLKIQIEKEYNEIFNKNMTRLLEKALPREIENLVEEYEKYVSKTMLVDYFLDDEDFEKVSLEGIDVFSKEFDAVFEEEDPALISPYRVKLDKEFKKCEDALHIQNKLNKTKAEEMNESVVNTFIEKYVTELGKFVEDGSFVQVDTLGENNETISAKIMKSYKQEEHYGTKKMTKDFEQKLTSMMEQAYSQILSQNETNQKNAEIQAEKLVNSAVQKFEEEVEDNFNTWEIKLSNENQFGEVLETGEGRAKEEFHNKLTEELKGSSEFYNEFVQLFKEKLDVIKANLEKAYEEKMKEIKQEIELNKKESLEKFTNEIDIYLNDATNLSEEEFAVKVDECKNEIFQNFESFLNEKCSEEELTQNFIEELRSTLEVAEENFSEKLTFKLESFVTNAKSAVADAKKEYQNKILPFVTEAEHLPKDETELQSIHQNLLQEAKDGFASSEFGKNSEFAKPFLEEIESGIQELYDDQFAELYKSKKSDVKKGRENRFVEAKKLYSEEMEKHFQNDGFLEPKVFEKCHRLVKSTVLKKLSKKLEFEDEKVEWSELWDKMYITYKEKNDLNTPTSRTALGIDLGTTYSCVAVYLNGKVEVIPNGNNKITPSYVCIQDSSEYLVGEAAKRESFIQPENTIYDAKRLIGLPFSNEDVQKDMKNWPFEVVDDGNGNPKIFARGKNYEPEHISALVLKQLKEAAEGYLKCEVKDAVITVPAYFTDGQKQATIDAGKIAGLNVLKIVPEPTAAAVAYQNLQSKIDNNERTVLIYDLGGGTFDVAVLKVRGAEIECKAISGNTHLGGQDFDQNLVDYVVEQHKNATGIDLKKGIYSSNIHERHKALTLMRRIRLACEERKRDLSSGTEVSLVMDLDSSDQLNITLTRQKFEELNQYLFDQTIQCVEKVLKDYGIIAEELDDVVLVGGSTRIPKIQQMLQGLLGGRALNKSVHQDEAVAHGAAILAGIMNGVIAQESGDYTYLTDVTPRSLGIEIFGGDFSTIIGKSSKFPVTNTQTYRTAHDGQTQVCIKVFEGENSVASKNHLLGTFILDGIPPNDAGEEEIIVDMNIDDQGILHVTATSLSTGGTKNLRITENKSRLSQDTIDRLLSDGTA